MWKKLGDFSAKRGFWEAILFYFVYGTAGVFLCGVITSMITEISSLSTVEEIKLLAYRVAPILAGIYTFVVSLFIICLKQLHKDAFAILCAIVGFFASMSLGLIFGFVPVTILSAISAQKRTSAIEV